MAAYKSGAFVRSKSIGEVDGKTVPNWNKSKSWGHTQISVKLFLEVLGWKIITAILVRYQILIKDIKHAQYQQ